MGFRFLLSCSVYLDRSGNSWTPSYSGGNGDLDLASDISLSLI